MSDYRHGSHTTFSIHLHIVWITKYRHKVLRGEVAERVRAIVREACQKARVDILKGHISRTMSMSWWPSHRTSPSVV